MSKALNLLGIVFLAVMVFFPLKSNAAVEEYEYNRLSDGTLEITGYIGSDTDIVIPAEISGENVTRIGNRAFHDKYNLKSVAMPDSITDIGIWAFQNCNNLIDISIPENITCIGAGAFYGCQNLASISIPDGVKSIGGDAFSGTKWLESEREKNPCVIGGQILIDGKTCSGAVDIPQGVKSIADSAFHGCGGRLTSVSIPSSVTNIGEASFVDCKSLVDIEIPEGTESIGDRAFNGCDNLTGISIPSSVKSIGSEAFIGTKWLENEREKNPCVTVNRILIDGRTCSGSISILKGVEIIAGGAFLGCKELKSINLPESLTYIGDVAFYGCGSLANINIPENLVSIGDYAFYGCSSLASISIPAGVTSIGSETFYGCSSNLILKVVNNSVAEQYAQENNIAYVDINGVEGFDYEEEEDGTVTITEYSGDDVDVVIPSEIGGKRVTYVRAYVFQGSSKLESIIFPAGITEIGSNAFRDCWQLSKVELPAELTEIGEYAFSNCDSLSKIELPEKVTIIGEGAFSDCENLREVELSAGLTEIGNNAFSYCESLQSIKFAENLNRIGEEAFSDCTRLSEIQLPKGLKTIEYGAFWCCENLQKVSIPKSVRNIGQKIFFGCNKDLVLKVCKGSYAEIYAKENNIKYSYVDSSETPACSHAFSNIVTKAVVGRNGSITKICTRCGDKTTTTIYAPQSIKLSKTSFVYNNKAKKPGVIILDIQGKRLNNKTDFAVVYPKSTKNVNQYTVAITFKGNYSGTVKRTFNILPKGTSISKVIPKKKGFTVIWKKQKKQVTGYEIAYSTDKKFKKKNTKAVLVRKNTMTSKTISKLKAKKKYYVRIRTYKVVKGKKYYSGWSKERSHFT